MMRFSQQAGQDRKHLYSLGNTRRAACGLATAGEPMQMGCVDPGQLTKWCTLCVRIYWDNRWRMTA